MALDIRHADRDHAVGDEEDGGGSDPRWVPEVRVVRDPHAVGAGRGPGAIDVGEQLVDAEGYPIQHLVGQRYLPTIRVTLATSPSTTVTLKGPALSRQKQLRLTVTVYDKLPPPSSGRVTANVPAPTTAATMAQVL